MPDISVIIRNYNEGPKLAEAIRSVRSQDVPSEIVVVDSGSTDISLQTAFEMADLVVEIKKESFTFGGALNLGAERAAGRFQVALSAHCALPHIGWLGRARDHLVRPEVAAVSGRAWDWNDQRIAAPLTIGTGSIDDPYWGYSNHAGAWDREVWRLERFSETIAAAEDLEWMCRVFDRGLKVVFDPRMEVSANHRKKAGWQSLYKRCVKESKAIHSFHPEESALTLREALEKWSQVRGYDSAYPDWMHKLRPTTLIEIAGRYAGERAACSGVGRAVE